MPAKFLYNLTKKLTSHLSHKLCAVLTKDKTAQRDSSEPFQILLKLFQFFIKNVLKLFDNLHIGIILGKTPAVCGLFEGVNHCQSVIVFG